MSNSILAICSHPDDETFGCGGTLAVSAAKGQQVDVICLTCTPVNRKNELLKAVNCLDVSEPIIWMEKEVSTDKSKIQALSDLIVEKRPEIVITHLPFDYHKEHRLTHDLVKEAIEWAGHTTLYANPWVVKRLLKMEVNTLIPNPHILMDISSVFDKKMSAIKKYESQVSKFPWDYYQSFNLQKAMLRGVQGNCEYAEAFLEESLAKNSPFYPDKSTINLL